MSEIGSGGRRDIALARPASFAPTNFADAMAFCKMLAQSAFVPRDFKGKPEEILAAIQFGSELGVGPMQALQNIAVINGKPSVYGDLALALVRASGLLAFIEESDDGTTATCTVKRKDDENPAPHKATFSSEDAKRAGLFGKAGPWQQYPAQMRKFRARGFCLRDVFPDVLKGLITREEAEDYPAVAGPSDVTVKQLEAVSGPVVYRKEDQTTVPFLSDEERKGLLKLARDAMGKQEGTAWVLKRMEELGITRATMGPFHLNQMRHEIEDYKKAGDEILETFEGSQKVEEKDIEF